MGNALHILGDNTGFFFDVYDMSALMAGFALLFAVSMALKGWALWRSARLHKPWWFIALLVVNSMGILPIIFLLLTNEQYQRFLAEERSFDKKQ